MVSLGTLRSACGVRLCLYRQIGAWPMTMPKMHCDFTTDEHKQGMFLFSELCCSSYFAGVTISEWINNFGQRFLKADAD